MCNHKRQRGVMRRMKDEARALFPPQQLPLRFPDESANYQPAEHVYPGRDGIILRAAAGGDGLEAGFARWGLVPFFHRKPAREWKLACQNCKSETMATLASFKSALARRRCLVPADAFYESCGRGTLQEWEITRRDGALMMFAGLWDSVGPDDDRFDSYTILTSEPGPDLDPPEGPRIHNRQLVALEPDVWPAWLDLTQPYDRLIAPPTAGGVLAAAAIPIRGRETAAF